MQHTTTTAIGGPVRPEHSRLRPLSRAEIRVVGGFWADAQRRNAEVTLAHCEHWLERAGWLGNFDRALDGSLAEHREGWVFADSEVYKLLEAMAWELGRAPSPALQSRYDGIVARVAAVQEPDGYLHIAFGRAGQPARYTDFRHGHELYCFGHLFQAAVARLRTGRDDTLVAVARCLADHIVAEFGPEGRDAVCGHPEVESALAELGRALGRDDYLATAAAFIARRGRGLLGAGDYGAGYYQDDIPVRDAEVLEGHAVRALYLASGAFDVAVELDDTDLQQAVRRQWAATVARRTYLTGGMGAHHNDEAFGADFELPADRAYAETCAAIASVMLSWRLLLDDGDPAAADLIERTLHNAVLSGLGAHGDDFFYSNTLHQREEPAPIDHGEIARRTQLGRRAAWFEVSCCPTNLARLVASADLYFATADTDGVQVLQYGDIDIDTVLDDGRRVRLEVRSGYPHEGRIAVRHTGDVAVQFALRLRVPSWAHGATLEVAGERLTAAPGLVTVERVFLPGDEVVLDLPLEPRFVRADPRVDAARGQVAVERGPLVLCLESPDLPAGLETEDVVVDTSAPPRAAGRGARVTLRRRAAEHDAWPYSVSHEAILGETHEAELIPYAEWANRGPSTMRVWMPQV